MFGFALLSYPFISNYIFEKSAGSTIKSYEKQVKTYDQKQKEKAFEEAKEYNEDLAKSAVQLTDPFKVTKSNGETFIYNNILTSIIQALWDIWKFHVSLSISLFTWNRC